MQSSTSAAPDVDEVVGVPEIQFGEDFGLMEGLKGGIDEWKGVLGFNSYLISPLINMRICGI